MIFINKQKFKELETEIVKLQFKVTDLEGEIRKFTYDSEEKIKQKVSENINLSETFFDVVEKYKDSSIDSRIIANVVVEKLNYVLSAKRRK